VVAAAARVKQETRDGNAFVFVTRGPKTTHANARVLLPRRPTRVSCVPAVDFKQEWDEGSSTLLLSFDNAAEDIRFTVGLR
jgi:hypothetical protein